MNPSDDIVSNLLETPFHTLNEEDKKRILNYGRPIHPIDICMKKKFKKTGKAYNIAFKSSWFTNASWLCSSRDLQKLFCWPCLLFSSKNKVWNKEGFGDFYNVMRALHKHEDSAEHLKCTMELKYLENSNNIVAEAVTENSRLYTYQLNENVRLNRRCMRMVIDAVLYLTKQEFAFVGHDKTISLLSRENFDELLRLLISQSSLEIQNHYHKIKSIFHGESKIQNELIDCISEYLQDHVKNEIKDAVFFSIQVDDATDICQKSQCSIIVRYVNSKRKSVERFLGFYDVSANRSAENLFEVLDSILKEFSYETKLIAQCYDGASVRTGHLSDLQNKIKDKSSQAVFVHCMSHRLNLVLQQSCKRIFKCRIFFATISGISSFFHSSLDRTHLPSVAETRWSSTSRLLRAITEDWDKLKQVFELIMNDEASNEESIQLCKGYLNDMNNFEFAFLAVVFHHVFEVTDNTSNLLQRKSLDVSYCIRKIKLTRDLINNKRNEQYFATLFEKSIALTGVETYTASSEDECFKKYRILYDEIVDNVLMEMQLRFQDYDKLQFITITDVKKFETYTKVFPLIGFQHLLDCYPKIFTKGQRLKNELLIFHADESYRKATAEEILQTLYPDKDIFEEVYKLFCLVLTIPFTKISTKSSSLKKLRIYAKNTKSEEMLSSLANITMNKELLLDLVENEPFYEDIIDKFAALKEGEIDLTFRR